MNPTLAEQFAKESNRIEGEHIVTLGQIKAVEFAVDCMEEITLENIIKLHKMCGAHLKADWVGKWRDCNVRVGRYIAPDHSVVAKQMKVFQRQCPMIDSWHAHNMFEKIHPFQDLNGRVGRLIWLHKAVKEGYDFSISFLHKYYYQTLNNSNL